jgi:signal transduction histidine kinase
VSRLPIRLRVTLAFAAVMAALIAGAGLLVYLQVSDQLDESIDDGLRSRATDLSALVERRAIGLGADAQARPLIEADESFAQVIAANGRVVDSTSQLGERSVLSADELHSAGEGPEFTDRSGIPEIEEGGDVRLLTTPAASGGRELVVVVGSSLEDRDEALSSLATMLLVGGPLALVLASLAGYGVASLALRPVEAMRRRADTISAGGPDARLPVPPAGDELTRLGQTLNEMLARLEAGFERERRFTDDAAHELRTPLALHKSELELALRYEAGEAELRRAIASAIEEVDRLVQLSEDLLVVARSDQGKLPLAPERLSAGGLFASVGQRFAGRSAEAGRAVRAAGGEELELEGDRLRLEQALTNMVDNAFRHGGGEVRMWASSKADPGTVELHVGDDGPGFPADFLKRAFERFSRADHGRERGGTGLGLAIVETIARAHGGHAHAANPPGGGADVWIEVPAGPSPRPPAARRQPDAASA